MRGYREARSFGSYCKKFTAVVRAPSLWTARLVHGHVVDVALIVGKVRRRVDAGEGAEIVDKVRLVEITSLEGDVGPVDARPSGNLPEDLLKAANAAEEFRRKADFVPKNVDEMARAYADSVRHR